MKLSQNTFIDLITRHEAVRRSTFIKFKDGTTKPFKLCFKHRDKEYYCVISKANYLKKAKHLNLNFNWEYLK